LFAFVDPNGPKALPYKDRGSPADWQEVLDGKAKEVRQRDTEEPIKSRVITLAQWKELSEADRAEALATNGGKGLNRQTTDSICWAKWSWNPITGRRHSRAHEALVR
jgi:hypothetical protein